MSGPDKSRQENWVLAGIFCAALCFHAWGASVGWNNLNLPGCEFRQTQTAISAHFILQEHNYSLAYPTPVLGKPWSIPMEFPLYQWTVAKLTEMTGCTLTQAGRAVSLACFYLTLPALYLLLRRLGLVWSRSLLLLSFVLSCPLYIFYARSFLIETMAWMFGTWFLLGYVHWVEKRLPAWLAVAIVGGGGAGLVKVTTLIAFLLPALAWTLVWFWQDWHQSRPAERTSVLLARVLRCGAAVALPFAAAWWWVRYSDGIKALSPAGAFLQSAGMAGYNFGVGSRFDAGVWAQHWAVLVNDIASAPVLVAAGLVAALCARRWWWLIGLLLGFFLAVQTIFPILYAWHEYYYVAIAMLLVLAIGLALCGLLESRVPRWLAWAGIAVLAGGQAWGYLSYHYPWQRMAGGGSDLTMALQAVTDPDDVIVIAGNDWSSMTPYYAQRRALMIRRNLETTWDVIRPAFDALKGEPVAALILYGAQRSNQDLLNLAVERFQLDRRPAFMLPDATVYLRQQLRFAEMELLTGLHGITLPPDVVDAQKAGLGREVDMSTWRSRHLGKFFRMTPRPWKYYSSFGLNPANYEGHDYLWVHPETRLWFKVPAGEHRLSAEMVLMPDAYGEKLQPWDRSDGVEVIATAGSSDGNRWEVGRRWINPRDNPEDRGQLKVQFEFTLNQPADLEFSVLAGPDGNFARDWALLRGLKID
jgi:4-amino-4-deoxy-L-arabinose transferase-like glycosyltransferase